MKRACALPGFAAPRALILSLFWLAVAGCSTFHRDWKNAATQPAHTNEISGRWEGRWQSEANGHAGRLRCLITKLDGGQYSARFHANYYQILNFGYTVTLQAHPAADTFQFKGEADLGRLAGGKYTYEGQATPTNFFSTYRAARDHGTFRMTRP
ncbi:MAG: hypothetical protein HYY23_03665 [Verrucomicrobia bacterium]|nr:hypothetical protein [Verrucomicrobiota bacterium]